MAIIITQIKSIFRICLLIPVFLNVDLSKITQAYKSVDTTIESGMYWIRRSFI